MRVETARVAVDAGDPQPDALDRMHRLESLPTDLGAVHDGPATEQPVGIGVQVFEPLLDCAVAAVEDEPVRLDQAGRTDESLRVPPVRRALARAAGAED